MQRAAKRTLKITVKKWLTAPVPSHDIRTLKTTITVVGKSFTVAVNCDGHHTRSQAIQRAVRALEKQPEQWPPSFITELWNHR